MTRLNRTFFLDVLIFFRAETASVYDLAKEEEEK